MSTKLTARYDVQSKQRKLGKRSEENIQAVAGKVENNPHVNARRNCLGFLSIYFKDKVSVNCLKILTENTERSKCFTVASRTYPENLCELGRSLSLENITTFLTYFF